ncbi:DNA cytosine methyltransferase [Algivirga pacifica]|uniref:Cytosine-specific methyltransferase n=1 Tax=Algivirga pacifica TaxID=1162670 RepID=A0ABP9DIA4_9BACT
MKKKGLILLDLFSGAGGFHKGIIEAGIHIRKSYFSEVDKHAINVYKEHFPKSNYLGAIEQVTADKIKETPDIITFGFPCQDLSIAGKKKGMAKGSGTRSALFYEVIRIVEELIEQKRYPKLLLFENVKGLISHNNGKTFQQVREAIANLGIYRYAEWQLLNTSWFLPQNRERVFFAAHLGEESGRKIFPIEGNSQENNKGKKSENTFALTTREGALTNSSTYLSIPIASTQFIKHKQNGKRWKQNGDDMYTITSTDRHGIWDGKKVIRKLTPTECERLQGFPDDWTINAPETQRYKLMGNAVSVPVVKTIFETWKRNVKI